MQRADLIQVAVLCSLLSFQVFFVDAKNDYVTSLNFASFSGAVQPATFTTTFSSAAPTGYRLQLSPFPPSDQNPCNNPAGTLVPGTLLLWSATAGSWRQDLTQDAVADGPANSTVAFPNLASGSVGAYTWCQADLTGNWVTVPETGTPQSITFNDPSANYFTFFGSYRKIASGAAAARDLVFLGTKCNNFWTMTVNKDTAGIDLTSPSFSVAQFSASSSAPTAVFNTSTGSAISFTIPTDGSSVTLIFDPQQTTSAVRTGWIGARPAFSCSAVQTGSKPSVVNFTLSSSAGRKIYTITFGQDTDRAGMAIGATLSLAALQSTFVTTFDGDAFGYWNNNRQLVVNATNQWVAVGGTVTFRSASCIRIAPWSIPYDAGTTALLDDPCGIATDTYCAARGRSACAEYDTCGGCSQIGFIPSSNAVNSQCIVNCTAVSDSTCTAANRVACSAGTTPNSCGECLANYNDGGAALGATGACIANCNGAPTCSSLYRSSCSATSTGVPNTCGPCLDGFTGTAGSANTACAANCIGAPNCAALNRSSCSTSAGAPNTCGSCLSGYVGAAGPSNVGCTLDCSAASDSTCAAANRVACSAGTTANTCGACLSSYGTGGQTLGATTACVALCDTAPNCTARYRNPCSATVAGVPNTCGACLTDFTGTAGSSNDFCSAICTSAPNCNSLNREACASDSGFPNTCGVCKSGYTGTAGFANTACTAVCTGAPVCSSLYRSSCSETVDGKPNTCGSCLTGFTGTAGFSNDPCSTLCTSAPNCASLNRGPCTSTSGSPNTCGPCNTGYLGTAGFANTACTADCSTAPNCASLFRNPCSTTVGGSPNTCGSCLVNYTGVSGFSNVACTIDCTTRSVATCNALNRNPCSATAFTCGTCKAGYSGTVGDSNDACTLIDLPTVSSARLSNDGTVLSINFAKATDQGGLATGTVPCASVLQAASLAAFGPSASTACRFESASLFTVTFDPAAVGSTVAPGSSVSFVANLLRTLGAVSGTFSLPATVVATVQAPTLPPTPAFGFQGATQVGACSDIAVGVKDVVDSSKRPVTVSWELASATPALTGSAADAATAFLSGLAAASVSLPTATFPPGRTFVVRATVRNWLGGQLSKTLTVIKAAIPLPQLQLQGASSGSVGVLASTFKTRSFTAATTYGAPTPCTAEQQADQFSLQLQWTQISTVEQLQQLAEDDPDFYASLITELGVSPSNVASLASVLGAPLAGVLPASAFSSPSLTVPPDTLTVGRTYIFVVQVQATRVSTGAASTLLPPGRAGSLAVPISLSAHATHIRSLLSADMHHALHTSSILRRAPLKAAKATQGMHTLDVSSLPTSVRRGFSAVKVAPRAPVAVAGSNRLVSVLDGSFTLDASSSYDPDGVANAEQLSYTWSCTLVPSGNPCFSNGALVTNQPVLNISTTLTNFTSRWSELFQSNSGSAIGGDSSSGAERYRFTVTVTNPLTAVNGASPTPAAATVDVYVTTLPVVPLSIGAPSVPRFDPASRLVLTASPARSDVSFTPAAEFRWSCASTDCAGLNLSSAEVTTTGATGRSLVLVSDALAPSKEFIFVFTVVDEFLGFASVTIRTASRPAGGNCFSDPPVGVALLTDFNLRCTGWTDLEAALPLSYSFSALSEKKANDSAPLAVTLRGVAPDANAEVVLPNPEGSLDEANVTVRATVRNSLGAETLVTFRVWVTKLKVTGSVAELAGSVVDNALAAAVESRDRDVTVQTTVALASVLSRSTGSSANSTATGSRGAKELRASMFSAIKEVDGASIPSPAADLQSLQAVRVITEDSSQLGSGVRGPSTQFMADKLAAYATVLNQAGAGASREGATGAVTVNGTAVKVEVQQVAQLPSTFVPTSLNIIETVGTSLAADISPKASADIVTEATTIGDTVDSAIIRAAQMQLHGSVAGERASGTTSGTGKVGINAQRNPPSAFNGAVLGSGAPDAPSFTLPAGLFGADGPSTVDSVVVVRSVDLKVRGYVPDSEEAPLDKAVDSSFPSGGVSAKVAQKTSVVSLSFFDSSNPTRAEVPVSGLSSPIAVSIPLGDAPLVELNPDGTVVETQANTPGQRGKVPFCNYFNPQRGWIYDGCRIGSVPSNTDAVRKVVCLCDHLTDFKVDMRSFVPTLATLGAQDWRNLTAANLSQYPTMLIGVLCVFGLYLLLLPTAVKVDRKHERKHRQRLEEFLNELKGLSKDKFRLGTLAHRYTGYRLPDLDEDLEKLRNSKDPPILDPNTFPDQVHVEPAVKRAKTLRSLSTTVAPPPSIALKQMQSRHGRTLSSASIGSIGSTPDEFKASSSANLEPRSPHHTAETGAPLETAGTVAAVTVAELPNETDPGAASSDNVVLRVNSGGSDETAPPLNPSSSVMTLPSVNSRQDLISRRGSLGSVAGDGDAELSPEGQANEAEKVAKMSFFAKRRYLAKKYVENFRETHMWMAVWFRKSRDLLNSHVRLTLVLAYIYGALMFNALFFGTAGTEALLLVAVASSLLATLPITLFIVLFRGGYKGKGGVPTKHEYHAVMLIQDGIPPSQLVIDRINLLQEQEDMAVAQAKAKKKAEAKAAKDLALSRSATRMRSATRDSFGGTNSSSTTDLIGEKNESSLSLEPVAVKSVPSRRATAPAGMSDTAPGLSNPDLAAAAPTDAVAGSSPVAVEAEEPIKLKKRQDLNKIGCPYVGPRLGWILIWLYIITCVLLILVYGVKFELESAEADRLAKLDEELKNDQPPAEEPTNWREAIAPNTASGKWLSASVVSNLQDFILTKPFTVLLITIMGEIMGDNASTCAESVMSIIF